MGKDDWQRLKAQSPVRIQWDPERSLKLEPLPHRSIQIGLTGEAVPRYVNEWIQNISEITDVAQKIHALIAQDKLAAAQALLPPERVYPFDWETDFQAA